MITKELVYWSINDCEILDKFNTSQSNGLSEDQVLKLREKYGYNTLKQIRKISLWSILIEQFKGIIVFLLIIASITSFIFQQWTEGIAIIAVLIINATIGFFTEFKATRSMESLRSLGQMKTQILRNGRISQIPAEEIVPGDIVFLEGGDIVTADIRLIESSKLYVDESALTGESLPIEKNVVVLDQKTELAERRNMLFKGTSVTNGSAKGVIVATGMETELGHISSLTEEAEQERTPLEKKLDTLGTKLVWLTLIIAVVIVLLGFISGKEIILMIQTGIALAVAAIPEGLPIVATIALARGMWLMSKKNALINKLSSVETLGAVTVICTDKTGTLTENKMKARIYELNDGKVEIHNDENSKLSSKNFIKALEIGALCNNANLYIDDNLNESGFSGDPTELALLKVAMQNDLSKKELLKQYPRIKEEAFDPEIKMMATYHKEGDQVLIAVKGAPEAILESCSRKLDQTVEINFTDAEKNNWLEKSNLMSRKGLRILALAYKNTNNEIINTYENLVFVGLVGLQDPPRAGIKNAIEQCKKAGIKVVMVTGDQEGTAYTIAEEIGLITNKSLKAIAGRDLKNINLQEYKNRDLIFYRVNPKQKLDLVTFFQKNNEVVAMTGDGVNDAPALKKADIGIAMGLRGTQVAKDVSSMILQDDSFNTIVYAIGQGRIIFTNIRRFVVYLLSCNLSEVLIIFLAAIINAPLPILPLHILYLNLITDVFPALALGAGEGDNNYLNSPPRDPKEPIIRNDHWIYIVFLGLLITISVLTSFFIGLNYLNVGQQKAITIAFLTLGFSQLFHVFNMSSIKDHDVITSDIVKNHYIWKAVFLCTFLLLIPLYIPGLSEVFELQRLNFIEWSIVIFFSLIPLVIGQSLTYLKAKKIS